MRRAVTSAYIVPAAPTAAMTIIAGTLASQGARSTAARNRTVLKCTTVGVEKAAPPPATRARGPLADRRHPHELQPDHRARRRADNDVKAVPPVKNRHRIASTGI